MESMGCGVSAEIVSAHWARADAVPKLMKNLTMQCHLVSRPDRSLLRHLSATGVMRQVNLKPGIWPLIFTLASRGGFGFFVRVFPRVFGVPGGTSTGCPKRGGTAAALTIGPATTQPFPASIHLQIQTFQSARTKQLEIACFGEYDFIHGLGLVHRKHSAAN